MATDITTNKAAYKNVISGSSAAWPFTRRRGKEERVKSNEVERELRLVSSWREVLCFKFPDDDR